MIPRLGVMIPGRHILWPAAPAIQRHRGRVPGMGCVSQLPQPYPQQCQTGQQRRRSSVLVLEAGRGTYLTACVCDESKDIRLWRPTEDDRKDLPQLFGIQAGQCPVLDAGGRAASAIGDGEASGQGGRIRTGGLPAAAAKPQPGLAVAEYCGVAVPQIRS